MLPVRRRLRLPVTALLLVSVMPLGSAAAADSDSAIVDRIDGFIRQSWSNNQVEPSPRADDYEFARRAALDIVGHIPSYEMLMEFLEDDSPDKRQRYVDRLLDDRDYVRNWKNIWANMLVGRTGNGGNRTALERWLRRALSRNEGYDRFVFELVAADGSSRENGAVGFLASHLNDGAVPATSITTRLFLGLQVQCTQCHNHPFNDWKQNQFWSMNEFFRGTRVTRNRDRGDFRLADEPTTEIIYYEKRSGLLQATQRQFVDGTPVTIDEKSEPREQLARLITDPEQPFMARAQVNRMWGHFFGYGFTRPIDDMGPHNPPSHPELLQFLTEQFREAGYDNKRLIRWITRTEAYNLTSRFGEANRVDAPSAGNVPLFSRMYLKRFTAEQLYDSLIIATQAHKANRNAEQAENQRRQWLRQFVQTFGTDENDELTTFNGTIPQALVMMNGQLVASAISGDRGSFLQKVLDAPAGDVRDDGARQPRTRRRKQSGGTADRADAARQYTRGIPAKIETLFLVALQRQPSEAEMEAFNDVYQDAGRTDPIVGLQDVFWAILNSNEFIINH